MIGKPQGNIRGLKYRPDPTRPGGGVFVAHGKSKREDFRDLPAGTVVLSQGVSDEENEGEELEAAAEVSSSSAAAPASSSSSFVPLSESATFAPSPVLVLASFCCLVSSRVVLFRLIFLRSV